MWLFGLGVAAPVVDTAAGLALGHPLPVTSLAVLAFLAARRGRLTVTAQRVDGT